MAYNTHGHFLMDHIKNALIKNKNPLNKYKNIPKKYKYGPTVFPLKKYKKDPKHHKNYIEFLQ
jgi:hypothetical protein